MICDDNGVSEILGYTVMVTVVSIAAIGLLSVCMGTLQATEKNMEFSGASGSLCSIAQAASTAGDTNNTYFSVQEISVPQDYELEVLDANDSSGSLKIYSGITLQASIRLGGIKLESPFRSITYEGGSVTANNSGSIQYLRSPSSRLYRSPDGHSTLYLTIPSVVSDSFAKSGGPVNIGVRCDSVRSWKIHTYGSITAIEIRSDEPDIWCHELQSAGFTVTKGYQSIRAVSTEVTDVYVVQENIEVEKA